MSDHSDIEKDNSNSKDYKPQYSDADTKTIRISSQPENAEASTNNTVEYKTHMSLDIIKHGIMKALNYLKKELISDLITRNELRKVYIALFKTIRKCRVKHKILHNNRQLTQESRQESQRQLTQQAASYVPTETSSVDQAECIGWNS